MLEQAIAKVLTLSPEEQDALALAILSMSDGDASTYPLDDATRASILEGLAEAERGHFLGLLAGRYSNGRPNRA